MPDPSDRDLAVRAQRGDADAFGELVQRYQSSVFNVCYRLMGERREAEDQAQEAFIRAYERLRTFDADQPFGPWMRRVAANVCLNRLQRARPITAPLDDEHDDGLAGGESDPESAREGAERAQAIRAAIVGLPPHYRAVIELRHFQDLSYDEIAKTLQISLSDVKSHLFRARNMLAEKLSA